LRLFELWLQLIVWIERWEIHWKEDISIIEGFSYFLGSN